MSAFPETRRPVAVAPRRVRRTDTVWIGLILVMTVIELVLMLADHGVIGSARWRPVTYAYGAFWAGLMHGWAPNFAGQPLSMFASYAFLHSNWHHLAGNAMTLGWLGLTLGRRCGPWRFTALYAISMLGGGLGYGLLATSAAPMVGASGAIMGLVAVWIVWESRDARAGGQSTARAVTAALWMTAAVTALNVAMFFMLDGLVAWQAHLGGFLAGLVAGLVLGPTRRPQRG